VLSDRGKEEQYWDAQEFFETGRVEVSVVMDRLATLKALPDPRGAFLDFGCGVGRVSRVLMDYFLTGYGIDISPTMIERAKQYCASDRRKPVYIVNEHEHLKLLPSDSIDFVYSHIVLQHLPRPLQPVFVSEFLRVLRPGGIAAFQVPTADLETWMGRRVKNAKRAVRSVLSQESTRRIKRMLGRSDATAGVVMDMNVLPENEVRAIIVRSGCSLLAAPFTNSTDSNHRGRIQFMTRDQALRYAETGQSDSRLLSQFFFVRKK
jgi:SAM-dependent methyltransferase